MPTNEENQRALDVLPPKSVRAILEKLIAMRRQVKNGEKGIEVPLAVFHLASGRDFTGRVLDADLEARDPSLLLQVEERWDVTYVNPNLIEAITVVAATKGVKELSFGRAVMTPGESAPSKLELSRKMPLLSKTVSDFTGTAISVDIAWEGVPDSPDARVILNGLVDDMVAVLNEIAADPMGKDALKSKVKKVWFGDGPNPGVAFQLDTILVTADLRKGLEGRPIRGALRVGLEKVL